MPEVSKEIVALLGFLLPGFLVAWLYYAFTSNPRPSQFERVVQALVFTILVKGLVVLEQLTLLAVGKYFAIRPWDSDAELVASAVSALLLGVLVAYLSNTDTVHRWFRIAGISNRSAYPNEWCTVFAPREQFIVLELKDGRRLYGWPTVWPSDPEKGHMFITEPSWVHAEPAVELTGTEGVLVEIKDVSHVEFAKRKEPV